MKISRFSPLFIIPIGLFFLATIVIAGNLSQGISRSLFPSKITPSATQTSKLKTCPDKWYKNEQPCVYQVSPSECEKQKREYFIVNGQRKEIDEMDVEWIKKNCEVNKPEIIY